MLLESTSRKWIDVKLAKDNLSLSTTKLIWAQMLKDDDGKSFYDEHKSDSKDAQIIRNSLKKIPVQLPPALWEPLRKYGLIRMPEEEQYHQLENAPLADEIETPYSEGVQRALSAVLALDPRTQELTPVFNMVSTLHHIISMIQGVLGNRVTTAPAQQDSVTIKRERIKEEPEDESSTGRPSKRIRHGEVIELD